MPSELLRSLLNKDSEETKNRMSSIVKEGLTVAAVGYAGYKGFQGSNITKEVRNALTGANREFYRAGENLRSNVAEMGAIKSKAKAASLQAFTGGLDIDNLLSGASAEDKRVFFASLFDVTKDQAAMSDDLKAIIKQGYEATTNLTDEQKARIGALYDSIKSDEKTLDNFRRRYSTYSKTKATLSASSETLTQPAGQVIRESYTNINDSNLRSTLDQAKAEKTDVIGRLNRLQKLAGKGGKIELVGFDEQGSTSVRSLYARVSFSGNNKTLNVPLYLAKDRNGNIMYRATENLSTRYVAPLKVLNAPELFNSVDLTSVKGGNLSQNKASYSFEEYVFERLDKTFGGHNGSLSNISEREISDFYEFQRSFGVDAPRGMVDSISNIQNGSGKRFVSHAFAESMAYARSAQSSRFLIAGLESFDPKLHGDIAKRLMQFFPDEVLGEGHSIIARIQDPFSRGQELSFTDIKDRTGRTALNAMARYGRIDEAIQEQTARGFQMVGRYEMASGVKGLGNDFKFGAKKNINLVGAAEFGQLIGISNQAKGVHGVNLASIMLSGKNASTLGLGEGMSYFGGTLKVNSSITDTVHDTGLARTSIMEELIAASNDPSKRFLTIGGGGADYTIEEFFDRFGGGSNEVVLGFRDQETAKIVKRKGMESFTLGISEKSVESGRTRYHITGEASQYLDRSKMFSSIIKDTTLGITEAQIKKKLRDAGLDESLAHRFFNKLNVDIGQTLFHGTDQIKKSPQYLSSQIAGSLKLFGHDTYETVMQGKIGADDAYLAMINEGKTTGYASLDAVPVKERKAAYLKASIQSAIEIIEGGADVDGFTKQEQIGRVLGAAQEHSKRFGVENFDDVVRAALTGGDDTYKSSVIKEISKGITFTAQYVSSGGIHTDYGRNLAKVEPRFMNYLYTSLRGNFGLREEEATKFIGQFLARQEGIEGRPNAILGMKLTSFGLTKMGDSKFASQIATMSGVQKLDVTDVRAILDAGADEAEVKELLSRNEGNIIDLEDLIADKKRLEVIKQELGGRSEIFLPGKSTFESLSGYTITKSGETMNIESEFSRYVTDLTQSISGLSEARTDKEFMDNFYGFKVATGSIAKVSGYSLRNSLTGRISGSGTYMGQGVIFGKDPKRSMVGGTAISTERLTGLYEALEKNKGYVLFQDSQGFLDSMTTYKQAITDQLTLDKFADGDIGEINKEAERRTGQRMQDFFFGMYGGERSGVTVTAQRNPNVYLAHFMPGIEMVRYDFDEGGDDPVMKLFYMGRGKLKTGVFKTALDEAILAKRNALLTGEGKTIFSDINDMKKHFARKIEIQKLIGVPEYELESDGKIKEETIKTKGRVNPFTGGIEYQDKTVRKVKGLGFLDEVDGKITRARTAPTSDTEKYAALLEKKMAEKRALIEQKLQAQSTIIKREAAIKGAYVANSSDPAKIKTETIKRYTTAQKIDDQIAHLQAQLTGASSDQEKARIKAEIQRKEASKSALKADANGKTYLEREARVRNNPALSEARAKLEQANQNIANAKIRAASLKAAQKDVRSSVAIRRNIVNNALGYLSTTLEGRNRILKEAKKYKGFHDQIKRLLAARPFDDKLDINQKTGRLRRSAIVALQATPNPNNPYKGSMVYTNDFFSQVMGIRESSIRRSSNRLANQVFDFQYVEGFIKDGVRIESFLDAADDDFFDADKIQRNLDEKTKAFNDLFSTTRAAKRGLDATVGGTKRLNFQEALEVFRQQYLAVNKLQAPGVSNLGEDLFSFFDDQVVPSSQVRPAFTPRQLTRYEGMFRAYQEMEKAQLIKDEIERLKKQKENVRFNLSRLAGLREKFTFDATSRQPPEVTLTNSFMGIPSSGQAFYFDQLGMTSKHKLSITPRMVADYFEINMKTLIRNSLKTDNRVEYTRTTINNLKTFISELIDGTIPPEKIDENKRLIKDTIALIRGTSSQPGTRELFLNQTSKILEEKIQTRPVGYQDASTFKPRFEYLEELVELSSPTGPLGLPTTLSADDKKILNAQLEKTINAFYSNGSIAVSTEDVRRAIDINPNVDNFLRNLSAFYGFNQGSGLAEIQYDEEAFFKNGDRLKQAKEAFYASGRFSKNPIEMLLSRFDTGLSNLFGGERRTYKVFENGEEKEVTSFIFKEELPIFEARQKAYADKAEAEKRRKEALERIKSIEAKQKADLDADVEYQAAKQSKLDAEARIAQIDTELASDPGRAEYDKLRSELNALNERTRGIDFSTARLSDGEINALRTSLFVNPNNIDSAPGLISQLETLNSGTRITTMEEFYNAYTAHSSKKVTIGGVDTTVEEATNEVFFKALGRHMKKGDVGGGIIYFPQFDVEMDLMRGDKTVGSFASRMDFSRFAIGDFDADIYQIYHDTSDVMKQRFQQNAEAFHGLYNTGAEFLIHMKELGKGMEKYGERLGAGSMTLRDFRLDQYEKERILKSVGGLDVQIKVGMMGLAHSMAEESSDNLMQQHFKRIRAGASLIAVAQESLVIKAKHLNVAADVGTEFLTALTKSYKQGTGDSLFKFFEDTVFKGTIYDGAGMDEAITLQNIKFTNLPDDSQTAKSLSTAMQSGVTLTKRSLKETMDIMARTVKEKGYHALGSDSRIYKTLERGDAFNMDQLLKLLSVSMEGGFTGEIPEDRLEEIMSSQRKVRENVAMNIGELTKGGRGYFAAAALGASYLAGVKTSPEVLDAQTKFSDMRARESIGGRQLYNMNHREHGNVSPSRFDEPTNMYNRPINLGETMVTRSSSMRMYGEAPTYSEALNSARRVVGAGGNAFLSIQDNRMPISNSYVTKSIKD